MDEPDTDDESAAKAADASGGAAKEPRLPFCLTRGVVTIRCEIHDALRDPAYFSKEMEAARVMWPSFKEAVAARVTVTES